MGPEGGDKVTILVARDSKSGATMSMWVPAKGVGHQWVVRRLAVWIDSLGYGRIILKSDQEESIQALQKAVKELRTADTVLENSPVGESRSNGLTEKAIQEVQGIIRTLLDHVESRLRDDQGETGKISVNDAVKTWLIEHSGALITRYKIGADGMTPYWRLKGK
eukprot:12409601-Karenia_brevis.AAC.1